MDEIFVHENYTNTGSKENDIALLRLGNVSLKQSKDDMEFPHEGIWAIPLFPEERVDLSTFPPACLPTEDYNIDGSVGYIYGE